MNSYYAKSENDEPVMCDGTRTTEEDDSIDSCTNTSSKPTPDMIGGSFDDRTTSFQVIIVYHNY